MGYILKTAPYVNDFQCIGGKCTMDCCRDWDIIWKKEDVEKLKSSAHSESLGQLIACSFINRDAATDLIKLNEDGDCPFHDKSDKLCKIQKELGAEYLSDVCRSYPISGTINNNVLTKIRFLSCPAVFDIIANDEKACDVYVYGKDYAPDVTSIYRPDRIKDVKEHPSLKYRNELFDFFYGILSSKKRDIHTSLIIGTLAAQTLSKLESGTPDRIPEGISALSKQINSPALERSLSDINPNYKVKLGVVQCILDSTFVGGRLAEILSALRKKGEDGLHTVNIEEYLAGLEKFKSVTAKKPYMIKNIIRCLYMCQLMPFSDEKFSIFDNYAYFCASAAIIDFFGAAAAVGTDNEKEITERFKTAVCLASHPLCHNVDRVPLIVNYLKEINCYSAGHLALIVK